MISQWDILDKNFEQEKNHKKYINEIQNIFI